MLLIGFDLVRQTCQGLREAHQVGLIHRDIKPANLFAAQRGGLYDVVKLLDFGLVKPVNENTSARLSKEGGISGTPLYMSPEQARAASTVSTHAATFTPSAPLPMRCSPAARPLTAQIRWK